MKLPRFLGNIVRANAAPELVTTRNFDEIGSVLENYAQEIENSNAAILDLYKSIKRIISTSFSSVPGGPDLILYSSLTNAVDLIFDIQSNSFIGGVYWRGSTGGSSITGTYYGGITITATSTAGINLMGGDVTIEKSTTVGIDLTVARDLFVTRNLAVNTNKFNVTAATGDVSTAGAVSVTNSISASGNKFRTSAAVVTGSTTDLGYGIFGASAGQQIQVDSDEIQSINNITPAVLYLNVRGGNLSIASASAVTQINGPAYFIKNIAVYGGVAYAGYLLQGSFTLDNSYHFILCNAAAFGSFTITLPDATTSGGLVYQFVKHIASANTVTIDAQGAQTIDGDLTVVLGGNLGRSRLVIISNGTSWNILELYEEGTYTATLTGCTTSPTATVSYVRNGKSINGRIGALIGTSNTTACTVTGMLSHLLPLTATNIIAAAILDNSFERPGFASIATSGIWTLNFYTSLTANTTLFTNSGTKGCGNFSFSYTLF